MKTQQITHVSDAAETSSSIRLIVLVTPGWENSRLKFQMDALKASDLVVFIDKPINREMVYQAFKKVFPPTTAAVPATVAAKPSLSSTAPVPTPTGSLGEKSEVDLLRETLATQQETFKYLEKLHTEAQEKLRAIIIE